MSSPQISPVHRVRAAVAQSIPCSLVELQAAIGNLVVIEAAKAPAGLALGEADRSVFDPASRTTMLLADRIPEGEETQVLAAELLRHHGQDAAGAVLGEGVKMAEPNRQEMTNFGEYAATLQLPGPDKKLFRSDGTLKGVTWGQVHAKRGACLQINLPKLGILKSLGVDGRDFHELYAKAVALVAGAKGVKVDSTTYRAMLETKTPFLNVNGIELETVAYVQAKTTDLVAGMSSGKGAYPVKPNSATNANDASVSMPASRPPEMRMTEYGWAASKPVLGYTMSGDPMLVTFECPDDDDPEAVKIYTKDSERWDVTEKIAVWIAIPDPSAILSSTLKGDEVHVPRKIDGEIESPIPGM